MQSILWGSMGPDSSTVDTALEQGVGKRQSLVHLGQSWAYGRKADGTPSYAGFAARAQPMLQARYAAGQLAILDWSGWDLKNQKDLTFNNAAVIRGDHDAFLHQFFKEAAAWQHPFMLMLDPEPNGDWFLYGDRTSWAQNAPGSFVQRWHHVHDIATAEGASNVTWLLAVNICAPSNTPYATSQPLANVYPGDSYVDWLGIDGFDFAGSPSYKTTHATATELFRGKPGWYRDTYAELTALAPAKPVILSSFASADQTNVGDPLGKAGVIASLFASLATTFPAVAAISYFNWVPDQEIWPLTGDALRAFAAGVQAAQVLTAGDWMPSDMQPIPAPPTLSSIAQTATLQNQFAQSQRLAAAAAAQLATANANLVDTGTQLKSAQDALARQTSALLVEQDKVSRYQSAASQLAGALSSLQALTTS